MSERRENQIFIHAPGLRRPHRRAGDQLLTLIMWGIYAYLWLPFISLIAWYLGIDLFYQEMVVNGGFDAFLNLSGWYLLVIFLILVVVFGWSSSNYRRFHDKSRRREQDRASDAEIAAWFGVQTDVHRLMKTSVRQELAFDPDGMLKVGASPSDYSDASGNSEPASSA